MSRPCEAHHPEPLADPYPVCRTCWLWAHDAGHREAWGGNPADAVPAPDPWAGGLAAAPRPAPAPRPAAAPRRTLPCVHLGDESRQQQCSSCGGKVMVRVFACDVYTETTLAKPLPGVQCCEGCPAYEPKG